MHRGPLDGAVAVDLTSCIAGSRAAMTLARRPRGAVGGPGA
jgi:hypothetical protein